jgi:Spy/CpxP family protein refolding chaperone
MNRLSASFAITALLLPLACLGASPYAGEQSRAIKSLSQQEIADYSDGKGMGFAKAAELNGYPGPAHVLELADDLALSPAQKAATEDIFGRMQTRARELGARLVEEERRLDELFASKTVSEDSLASAVKSIAALRSDIRVTHLRAHLELAHILTAEQAARYWHLRGYANEAAPPSHRH